MLTEPSHSPGPWTLNTDGAGDMFVSSADNTWICDMAIVEDEDTTKVNAAIIAKAPEMLTALREIMEWDDGTLTLGDEPWLEMMEIARRVLIEIDVSVHEE